MGINGVVIGTIAAMIFLLLKLQYYCYSYILKNIYKHSLKILLSDFIIIISSCYFCSFIEKSDISYISWIIKAIKVSLVWLFTTVIVNFAINRIDMKNTIQTFFKRTSKKYI